MVTEPQTHTHKQTGPITIHCAAKLSAQCNYDSWRVQIRITDLSTEVLDPKMELRDLNLTPAGDPGCGGGIETDVAVSK